VIAFGTSEKAGDIILSIVLYPRFVTFFLNGVALSDPFELLAGSGSAIRGVKLRPIARLDSEVPALIDAAELNARRFPCWRERPDRQIGFTQATAALTEELAAIADICIGVK